MSIVAANVDFIDYVEAEIAKCRDFPVSADEVVVPLRQLKITGPVSRTEKTPCSLRSAIASP